MIDRSNVVITDVHAVLPDRVLADATVVVREGRIAEVLDGRRGGAGVVDGRGAVLIPGLVDSHSDAFEKELRPRPGVELPLDFALGSFEGRAAAAGAGDAMPGRDAPAAPQDFRSACLGRNRHD